MPDGGDTQGHAQTTTRKRRRGSTAPAPAHDPHSRFGENSRSVASAVADRLGEPGPPGRCDASARPSVHLACEKRDGGQRHGKAEDHGGVAARGDGDREG